MSSATLKMAAETKGVKQNYQQNRIRKEQLHVIVWLLLLFKELCFV